MGNLVENVIVRELISNEIREPDCLPWICDGHIVEEYNLINRFLMAGRCQTRILKIYCLFGI